MPNKNKNNNSRTLNNLLDYLDKQTADLRRSTYYSTNASDELYNRITSELDDAIRKVTDGDGEYRDLSNITRLLQKTAGSSDATTQLLSNFGKNNGKDIASALMDNELATSLMETYAKTRWITELDAEYDIVCKYMPKLQSALDIQRDTVLCSDSYSKEFLNIIIKNESPESERSITIRKNIEYLKKKYHLEDKVEKWYEDTSKYGEEFVYCVPYDLAVGQLLARKGNTSYTGSLGESALREAVKEYTKSNIAEIYNEAYGLTNKPTGKAIVSTNEAGEPIIKITIDKSKFISEVVASDEKAYTILNDEKLKGLSETFLESTTLAEAGESFNTHLKKKGKEVEVQLDKTIADELEWEDDSATDGLVSKTGKTESTKTNVGGAILKTIRHDRILPLYIEDTMIGAYYIENDIEDASELNANSNANGYNSITSMFNNGTLSDSDIARGDRVLRIIAGQISKQVDAAFINANADLKDEIYLMLKYNDKYNQVDRSINMNVTFVPADDIHHLKFREDKDTHRGISDLYDSLVAAKQWIMLNVTSVLGWITRGFDRRVYYVRQSMDTNVAQSLLNVINTIKKGNFGIRQMESINNILNILGRFNDFVIPIGPSGDAPVQFDTMPGQQFDFPQELMQNLEESAVNATGVPIEIVNSSTSMDFAVRYTMTNAKLLRNVLKRQFKVEDFASDIVTKLYKFEFKESVELEIMLPPPAFLSMTQGTQLLNNANEYANVLAEIEMASSDDAAKAEFKRRIIRKLAPTYIDDDEIKNIKDKVSIGTSINNTGGNSEDVGY